MNTRSEPRHSQRIVYWICCILLIISSGYAQQLISEPGQETGDPFITNYSPLEYNAHAQNWAIVQDARGILYFGNSSGVLTYDGVKWELLAMPGRAFVRSLAIDPETQRIYVGSVSDFGFLDRNSKGALEFHSLLEIIAAERRSFTDVWDTHYFDGQIYFLTDNILFRYTPGASAQHAPDGTMEYFDAELGFHTSFVAHDNFYVREWDIGLKHLVKAGSDSLELVDGGELFANERIYVMQPMGDGRILIGTRTSGLISYDGSTFTELKTDADNFLYGNQLFLPGTFVDDNVLALGTLRGGAAIVDLDGNLRQIIDKASGLQNEVVSYLFKDRENLLWMALNDGIAKVETQSPLTFFGERRGVEGTVYSITRHQGQLYIATSFGVFALQSPDANNQNFNFSFVPIHNIASQAWDLLSYQTTDGKSWLIAGTIDGLYYIKNNAGTNLGSFPGVADALTVSASPFVEDLIYVGHRSGLASLRYDTGVWRTMNLFEEVDQEVRTIVEYEYGKLWVGTTAQGALNITHNPEIANSTIHVSQFGTEAGLPSGWIGTHSNSRSTLFTSDLGIYRFDESTKRFTPDSTFGVQFADGSRDVEVVVEDESGGVWFGSEEAGEVSVVRFTEDGQSLWEQEPFLRMPRAAINVVYPEAGGIVWFGGYGGLVRYDSNLQIKVRSEFPAIITRITTKNDSVVYAGDVSLGQSLKSTQSETVFSYSQNQLRFDFAAPSYVVESQNRFQTMLEGFDDQWSAWAGERWKEYTNLPEGSYAFHVRAKNVYNHHSSEAVFHFTVMPPWYREWWTYLAILLFVGIATFLIDRMQRQRLIAKEREKTRIALLEAENQRKTEEMEQARELQLSMLPRELPALPEFEIAAYMSTATEVGGDYYDFFVDSERVMTALVGDATGHGLNAGMMVTAVKSLFASLVGETELLELFVSANKTLNKLKLRGMYMALMATRIRGNSVELCAAGMPPLLIHHAKTDQIEERLIKAMPLGGVSNFPYRKEEFKLEIGDTLVLMSDGFPERMNAEGEMLDYEQMVPVFREVADKSPQEIIDHMVEVGHKWAGSEPQNDDVTFVVIRMK